MAETTIGEVAFSAAVRTPARGARRQPRSGRNRIAAVPAARDRWWCMPMRHRTSVPGQLARPVRPREARRPARVDDRAGREHRSIAGRSIPGSAAALAFGLNRGRLRAVEEIARWHRRAYHPSVAIIAGTHRRRVRLRSKVTEIVADNSRSSARVRGVRTAAGTPDLPRIVALAAPTSSEQRADRSGSAAVGNWRRYLRIDHRGSYLQIICARAAIGSRRPTRHSTIRACRHR